MKNFNHANGHVLCRTLTAQELINELSKYPKTLPVLISYEGVAAHIEVANFDIKAPIGANNTEKCLAIDANDYCMTFE
jgi:hypothetical protein